MVYTGRRFRGLSGLLGVSVEVEESQGPVGAHFCI